MCIRDRSNTSVWMPESDSSARKKDKRTMSVVLTSVTIAKICDKSRN